MARRHRGPISTLGWVLLAACGADSDPQDLTIVRDSSGIVIVESQSARWADDAPIEAADELVVQIGAAEGTEAERLYRVGSIRWIDDARFVLANLGTELRIYDAKGAFIRQIGREGDGPGEFRRIEGVSVLRDGSIAVADGRLRRVTVLDTLGRVVRTTDVEGPLPRSPDLVGDTWFVGRVPGQASISGPRLDRLVDSIIAVHIGTGERVPWATTPGRRISWRELPNGLPAPLGVSMTPIARVAGRGDRVLFGSPDTYELRQLDGDGALVRILRKRGPARILTEEYHQPYFAEWERVGSPEYGRPEFGDSIPHFRAILPDDEGKTWVQVDEGRLRLSLAWDVFSDDGALLGRIQLPPGFLPHDVRAGRVVGVWRDALDVEYVQVRKVQLPVS